MSFALFSLTDASALPITKPEILCETMTEMLKAVFDSGVGMSIDIKHRYLSSGLNADFAKPDKLP